MQKLLSELNFVLGDDSWIHDDSHIFGPFHYRHIVQCIQFLLSHLPFQAHHDIEPVSLADSEGRRIYSEMNTGNSWWDTQYQLPGGAKVVTVICASDKTHWTNLSGNRHAWPRYIIIVSIRKYIRRRPKEFARILIGLIPCPPQGATNIDEAWHSEVGTVLSQFTHLDIASPGLKWDFAVALQRQSYPLLAAWVGYHPEQLMVA